MPSGTPSLCSARTQILSTSATFLEDLELLEKADHSLVRVAFVNDYLAGLAGLGRLDRDHLLAGAGVRRRLDGSSPRSATVTSSTGLDFAAMIPLNDG